MAAIVDVLASLVESKEISDGSAPRPNGSAAPRPNGSAAPRPNGSADPRPNGSADPSPNVTPTSKEAQEEGSQLVPVPEEGKKKVKKEKQLAIPKDSATFFRARAKDPRRFTFTADGNLQVPEMRGEAAKVINLPFYRPASIDEKREMEEAQMEEIKGVEREIDETAKLLREAIVEWRQTGFSADVIKYQRDLQRLDAQRTQIRSPVRWTKTFKNLSIRDVLVTEVYEVKKLGYPVDALRLRGLTFENMVRSSDMKPVEEAKVADESGADESGGEGEGEEFVLFFNPADVAHGFLSPDTMVEFIFNATKYNSLIQAYQAERVTILGRKELRAAILKSRSPTQMRVIGSKVVGQVEDPRELWINILKSLTSQHPHFTDSLVATGDATLVYADPRDGVLGIGLPVEDPQATDRAAWKGTNLLGLAWQAVRKQKQEEVKGPVEAQSGGAYTEHGTTRKESNDMRSRVLMGHYRKKF